HLVPLQERSIYFLAPESDGAVFRLHSNIVVSSLRWRNDLSLSEKTINVSRWGTRKRSCRFIFGCKIMSAGIRPLLRDPKKSGLNFFFFAQSLRMPVYGGRS